MVARAVAILWMPSQNQKRKRLRRKLARRKQAIRRLVCREYVEGVFSDALELAKKREENGIPMRWCFTYCRYCYVCEKGSPDIDGDGVRGIPADNRNHNYGWLVCPRCLPWVIKKFRPEYSLSTNMVCLDSLLFLKSRLPEVNFLRRSRTLDIPACVQLGTIEELFLRRGRILALVSWDGVGGRYEKGVYLSNIIREEKRFPQTSKELLRIMERGNAIITRGFFGAIRREYLLLSVWRYLENRLNSEVVSTYGWFSND